MTDQKVSESLYNSEVVDLPSKGVFYPEDSPLRSGQIEIYYMTAKHEDILTSTNLIQKGVVLDKLMDALIATRGVKSSDLLLGDLNAAMVAARILGYGKEYDATFECPACGTVVEKTIDLTQLGTENEPDKNIGSEFSIVLPLSKKEVTLKLLTRADELAIEKEIKALKKIDAEIDSEATSRLKGMIVAVDGDRSPKAIWTLVETMLVKDARYIRDKYKEKVPDVKFDLIVDCSSCGNSYKTRLPMGVNFFWPDAKV